MHETHKSVNLSILKSLEPLSALPENDLKVLARDTFFQVAEAGERLFCAGFSDPWAYYLVSGEVILQHDDSDGQVISAGTDAARFPLSNDKPRRVSGVAKGDAIILRFPDTLLQQSGNDGAATAPAPATPDEPIEYRLFNDIERALKHDKLIIPSLPDVALKVREAVNDPDTNPDLLTRIIQIDPPLAARLIQVANSPMYRGQKSVSTCKAAVSRLGMSVTRDLVLGCSLQQLFESDNALLKKLLKGLWHQSTQIAALCAVLGRFTSRLDNDRALLAGLIHNIGALPVIGHAGNYPELAEQPEELVRVIHKLSGRLGALVLKHWEFDPELIAVAKEARNWRRNSGPQADYCDLTQVAIIYSHINTPQRKLDPAIDSIPAFRKLPLGELESDMTLKVLETARADIDAIQRLLSGS